jgi:putative ABC transport system permease protein
MKLADWILRARALFRRAKVESELDEELKFHLEMETRKRRAAGADNPDASRQARIAFGGEELVKERCRDERRTGWIEDFFRDLRFAARVLLKDRGYTAAAVLALALGIGSNTALFTLFAAVVLKPLPVPAPQGLVNIWRATARVPRGGQFSFADYVYYRDHNSVLANLAAEAPEHLRLAGASSPALFSGGVAEPVMALFVTSNYLATFGVRPAVGRDFLPEEQRLKAGPYPVMLNENYWERRFGRDSRVIGQNLLLSGMQTTVIGITPRDFMGTRPYAPDVWLITSALGDVEKRAADRQTLSNTLTGRLKPGVTIQQANAELGVLAESLRRGYPERERQWSVVATPATRFGAGHDAFIRLFGILQVAMGMVLLIACSNVAGLLLGRAASRQREVAVRLSIGATRGRLVRQLLTEGLLLAFIAGIGSFVVTWQGLAVIGRTVSAALAVTGGTIVVDVSPDYPVFIYILLLSIGAGVSFALAPALQSTRVDLVNSLKSEGAVFGLRQKGRLRGWIVAGQIAVCLSLLIGAGLLTASSLRVLALDPGYETRSVVRMAISSPEELGYSAARVKTLEAELYGEMRRLPGVQSVSFTSRVPLDGNVSNTRVTPAADGSTEAREQPQLPYMYISREYFQTLGIPLLRGRGFTAQEIATNAPVAVISEGVARRFWPEGDAIGKRIALGSPTEVHFAGRRVPLSSGTEVIGVTPELYTSTVTARDPGLIYLPKPENEWNGHVLVRVAGDADAAGAALVKAVHNVEARLPVTVETLRHVVTAGETSSLFRVGAIVFGAIGALGFGLAAIGIYSMVAYSVSQQTREIGIRMALGARRGDVVRLTLMGGFKWIAAGLVIGAALGAALSRLLASQLLLEGREFLDPAVIVVVALLTGGIALVAAFLPALRASKLDPALALRTE